LQAAAALRAADGRTFFAVPWNEVTLIGTTDLDEDRDPADVGATHEEVDYLLREAGAFLDLEGLTACYTTSGVRALLHREEGRPSEVPRGHVVEDHAKDGLEGLFSVIGGKMTTARAVAHEAVSHAARFLGRSRAPVQWPTLPGATLDAAVGPLSLLGARALLATGPALCARHATQGMVRLAVEQEQCTQLSDFMLRRSLAGHAPDLGAHCAPAIARTMGDLLGWDAAEREAQQRAWEQEAAHRLSGLAT
jgi:glycerol-3-phosphate dehydrogenase